MLERWGPKFAQKTLICGDSAGIVMVLGITLGYSPEFIGDTYLNTGKNAPWGILHNGMSSLTTHCLKVLIKDPNSYKIANNRISIGSCNFFAKHIWTSHWESQDELLQTMKSSLHIPFLCSPLSKINGKEVIDGALIFSGKDLPHGDATLYVGIDPGADITTTLSIQQILFPSLGEKYTELEKLGYESLMKWDGKTYKKKIENRHPKLGLQLFLWVLKFFEIIVRSLFGPWEEPFLLL